MTYQYNDYLADQVNFMRQHVVPPFPDEYDHDVFRENVNFEFDPETGCLRFAWAHCPDSDRMFMWVGEQCHVYHGMTRDMLMEQIAGFIDELIERNVTLLPVNGYGKITECVVARCGGMIQ